MSLPLILEFHENISMSSQHLLVMKSLSENCGSDKWTDLLNFPQRGSSTAGIWIQLCLNLKVGPLVLKVLELTACTLLCGMSGISDSLVLLKTNQNVHLCKIMRWIVCSFKFEYHHPRRVLPKCPAKWFCFQSIKSWLIFLPVEFGQHSTAISNHTVGAQTFVEQMSRCTPSRHSIVQRKGIVWVKNKPLWRRMSRARRWKQLVCLGKTAREAESGSVRLERWPGVCARRNALCVVLDFILSSRGILEQRRETNVLDCY